MDTKIMTIIKLNGPHQFTLKLNGPYQCTFHDLRGF